MQISRSNKLCHKRSSGQQCSRYLVQSSMAVHGEKKKDLCGQQNDRMDTGCSIGQIIVCLWMCAASVHKDWAWKSRQRRMMDRSDVCDGDWDREGRQGAERVEGKCSIYDVFETRVRSYMVKIGSNRIRATAKQRDCVFVCMCVWLLSLLLSVFMFFVAF